MRPEERVLEVEETLAKRMEISKCWVDGFTKLSQWSFPTLMIP